MSSRPAGGAPSGTRVSTRRLKVTGRPTGRGTGSSSHLDPTKEVSPINRGPAGRRMSRSSALNALPHHTNTPLLYVNITPLTSLHLVVSKIPFYRCILIHFQFLFSMTCFLLPACPHRRRLQPRLQLGGNKNSRSPVWTYFKYEVYKHGKANDMSELF